MMKSVKNIFFMICILFVIITGILAILNLNFLNDNSGAFTVLFSGIVALATVVYAILTWKLVSETKELREAQTEPRISVIYQPREEWINFIDLVIKNIGLGPAYDIKFEITPDFEYRKGHFLSELNFMKKGIKYLAPNQRIQFFLTSMVEDFENKIKKPFTIKVIYKNKFGKKYSESFVIDFSELVGLGQLGEPPLHKIAKNIENIQRDIHHLSTGFHRLKTIIYTKKDIEEENKQLTKQIKTKKSKKVKKSSL
ncbi:MAG: hypothetical protein DRP13_00590 [Candidatus Aenigmatarchaeota archaeon]|nr:MAG: hypothetical protein DRP13_00590 [Candidatus Aenigmarchaeota archaeon]